MPSNQDRRASAKLIQSDYDRIETFSDDLVCRCISERTIQMLLAICEQLHWKTRWYGDNIDTDKIDEWASRAEYQLMSDCDCNGEDGAPGAPGAPGADGEDCDCEPLTDVPILDPDDFPGQDIDCIAAANATLTIIRLTEDLFGEFVDGINPFALATAIFGLFVMFGAIAFSVLVGMATLIIADPEGFENYLTDSFDALRCILLAHSSGGVFSDIEGIKADIDTELDPPASDFLKLIIDALQLSGLQSAAALGELTEYECDCDEEPPPCECVDCTPGTLLTFQESAFTYNDNSGSHTPGTYAGRVSVWMQGDAEAIVTLSEERCVKSIGVVTYESSGHNNSLGYEILIDGVSEAIATWSQGSVGWAGHSAVFITPKCATTIAIKRPAGARPMLYIDYIDIRYCD